MKDFYRIIGLAPTATLEQIKGAYRKRASALHPDRNPSETAHAQFQELQERIYKAITPETRIHQRFPRHRNDRFDLLACAFEAARSN